MSTIPIEAFANALGVDLPDNPSYEGTFLMRARPYAAMGIPVFPLNPRDKTPLASMADWPERATTDIAQIRAWHKQSPEANCGLAFRKGEFLALEFDASPGLEEIAKELGQPVPATRVHRSGKGGYHWIFAASEVSDRLGNRQARSDSGGEWFSLRSDRRYVVSPGSIHPNGSKYTVVRDVPPAPIPDWLCQWIASRTQAPGNPKEAVAVSDEFDFSAFLDHYDLSVLGTKDGWHTLDVCPVAQYRHQHSVYTGLFFNGEALGFKCFAGGCAGSDMSIGGLIKHLNTEHDPYPGVIWDSDDSFLDDAEWVDVDELLEDTIAEQPSKAVSEPEPTKESADPVADLLVVDGLTPKDPLPVPDLVEVNAPPVAGLYFDERALYGKLGEIAQRLAAEGGIPLGYGYPAILACASALRGVADKDGWIRSNLYVALLGDVGYGKSAAMRAAAYAIPLPEGVADAVTPSSDRGLAKLVGDEGAYKLLLLDEYRATLQKCNIQGSSLPQMFNALWNSDEAGGAVDKKSIERCNGHLSVLGNLTCADSTEFGRLFGAGSVSGMVDRHLFGWHDKPVKWRPPSDRLRFSVNPVEVTVPTWVWDAKDQWLGDNIERRRLSEHMLRVALVTASCNRDHEITKDALEAAMRFAEWQERLRGQYRPGVAETKDAECFEAIMNALVETHERQVREKSPHPKACEIADDLDQQCRLIHWTRTLNGKSYYRRYSAALINRAKKSLIDEGFIREVEKVEVSEYEYTGREKTTKKKTPFVRLVRKAG